VLLYLGVAYMTDVERDLAAKLGVALAERDLLRRDLKAMGEQVSERANAVSAAVTEAWGLKVELVEEQLKVKQLRAALHPFAVYAEAHAQFENFRVDDGNVFESPSVMLEDCRIAAELLKVETPQ
jgi:asparagine synthetase A